MRGGGLGRFLAGTSHWGFMGTDPGDREAWRLRLEEGACLPEGRELHGGGLEVGVGSQAESSVAAGAEWAGEQGRGP